MNQSPHTHTHTPRRRTRRFVRALCLYETKCTRAYARNLHIQHLWLRLWCERGRGALSHTSRLMWCGVCVCGLISTYSHEGFVTTMMMMVIRVYSHLLRPISIRLWDASAARVVIEHRTRWFALYVVRRFCTRENVELLLIENLVGWKYKYVLQIIKCIF